MYFDLWRPNGGPTQFFQVSIPTTYDPFLLALTFVVIVISIAFAVIIPGFRGISVGNLQVFKFNVFHIYFDFIK